MKKASLKLKRLRAMSLPEIFFRLFRLWRDKADKKRLLSGRTESPEAFISRLHREAATPEEKFQVVWRNFKNRTAFSWQKKARTDPVQRYKDRFAENFKATLSAAAGAMDKKFIIFGESVSFDDEIDWHVDPLSGRRLPLQWWSEINYYDAAVVREVKYVWELNRCQHFVTLGKAFYLTHDEKYAQELLAQWLHWIEKNPYKTGVNWTSSLECAFRLLSWTWALHFVKESRELNAARYARILQSVEQHVHYILGHLSKFSSANNHILGEALGLIYAGCYYPEFPAASEWRDKGFSIFDKEFLRQVHKDGVGAEQAAWYHRYVFDFGILAALAAAHVGKRLRDEVLQRLQKMADFIATIIDRDGHIPNIGDDDGGEALRLVDGPYNEGLALLATAAHFFQRKDLHPGSGNFNEAAFWLFGGDEMSAEKKETPDIVVFPDGGYVALTRHDPEQKLLFDCGPLGLGRMAAHGHADALSFTLSVNGEPLIIDSGAWMYLGAGEERNFYRGARAHTTVVVDGKDQSEMLGPFQWGRRARCTLEMADRDDGRLRVQARHDGYKKSGIIHSRRLESDERGWRIVDRISGVGIHQIDAYFQLAPCKCTVVDNGVSCRFQRSELLFQIDAGDEEPVITLLENWFSPRFGERKKHPVLRISATAALPLTLKTKITVHA